MGADRIEPIRRVLQGLGRDVRIALDHHAGLPSAEALELMRRRFGLSVPSGERVPQIMAAEVRDTRVPQRVRPCLGPDLLDRLS